MQIWHTIRQNSPPFIGVVGLALLGLLVAVPMAPLLFLVCTYLLLGLGAHGWLAYLPVAASLVVFKRPAPRGRLRLTQTWLVVGALAVVALPGSMAHAITDDFGLVLDTATNPGPTIQVVPIQWSDLTAQLEPMMGAAASALPIWTQAAMLVMTALMLFISGLGRLQKNQSEQAETASTQPPEKLS